MTSPNRRGMRGDLRGVRTQPPAVAVGGRQGERRWAMAAAVVSVGVLQELVPTDFRVLPRFVYPVFLLCFLGVLILGTPGGYRQHRWLRVTTLLMTGLITLLTAVPAGRLVVGILTNATFSTASQLLIIGGASP